MELFSYILSQFVHCWCIEKLLIFICWFCILLHCWISLWDLGVFQWNFFGSLKYRIMLSANRDTLTISLPICTLFISSSCLIAVAGNCRTMLNRSVDSRHTYLVPDFRGNGFCFSPLSMMLTIGLTYAGFIMLSSIPSILSFLRSYIMKWCWFECYQSFLFFCICWDDQVFFLFASIIVLYYIYWFAYV
jgi:hypothetical protein